MKLCFVISDYPQLKKSRIRVKEIDLCKKTLNFFLIIPSLSRTRKLRYNLSDLSMKLLIRFNDSLLVWEAHVEGGRHLRPSGSHYFHVSFLLAKDNIIGETNLVLIALRIFAVRRAFLFRDNLNWKLSPVPNKAINIKKSLKQVNDWVVGIELHYLSGHQGQGYSSEEPEFVFVDSSSFVKNF